MANATNDAEDGKLWSPSVEKHFIDVLVEEELRGNVPQGQLRQDFGHPLCVSLTYKQIKITTKNNLGKNIKDWKFDTESSPSFSDVREWDETLLQKRL